MTRQAFGQHFLNNAGIIQKILGALDLSSDQGVLEIGPGKGALTFPLLEKLEDPKKLLLVEKDPRMVEFLQEHFQSGKSPTLLQQDFLQVSWETIINILGNKFSVVSNLPYESSVAIFLHLLEHMPPGASMVLMFQKEVAGRLKAQPRSKDYGSLSVYTQVFANISKVCEVSPYSFTPPPKVESSVLKITVARLPKLPVTSRKTFEALLRKGFAQRRKMLRQKLKDYAGGSVKKVEEWLEKLGLSAQARAEELSPEQWVSLFKWIGKR